MSSILLITKGGAKRIICWWVGLANKPLSLNFKHTSQAVFTVLRLNHNGIQQSFTTYQFDHIRMDFTDPIPEHLSQFLRILG